MSIVDTAETLRRLHSDPELLQVVNVWDVVSAKAVAMLPSTRAIATASHSIAATFGYPDGEQIPVELMLDMAGRIARAVDVPVTADLHAGELLEIPDLAVLIKSGAEQAGITLNVAVEPLDTFYGAQWCPGEPADPPCSGAAELGIVDYGHRATPDVYLNAALSTKGIWNSSQYSNPDFDAAFAEFQQAVGVDAQKAACTKLEQILLEDTPVVVPYFYNYIAGWSKKFDNIRVSALGQVFVEKAVQVA